MSDGMISMLKKYKYIFLGLVIGPLSFLLDALLEAGFESSIGSVSDFLIPHDGHTIIHRLVTMVLIIAFGFIVFIAEAKDERMKQALLERRNHYLNLADATFSGILLHRKGIIIEANAKAADLFRYKQESFIGMNTLELTAPESKGHVLKMTLEERDEPYEAIGLRSDGSTFHMEVLSKNITFQGQPARISAIRDISSAKNYHDLMKMRLDTEDLLLNITSMFVSIEDVEKILARSLKQFGVFSGVCRVHLFEIREEDNLMEITHEWCEHGCSRLMDDFRRIAVEDFNKELERVRQVNNIEDLLDFNPNLPPEEKETMEFIRHGGNKFADIPLYSRKGLTGMLSFEYPEDCGELMNEQIMLRQIFSSIVEVILDRKRVARYQPEE